MVRISFILIFCLITGSCAQTAQVVQQNTPEKTPKNIILLVGDGMGLSQISASFYFSDQPSNFERFPIVGLIKTSSSAELITDSAAAATAFASGIKSYNGAIGVDPGKNAVPTIVERVSEIGYDTGVVSTSAVVHATPASFYAHVEKRSMYDEIAAFIPRSTLDFVAGGGSQFFVDRADKRNLYDDLRSNGFQVHTESMPAKVSAGKHVILLAENAMPKMLEGRGDFLPNATSLAIDRLSQNKNGFFLMVEGSQIDWGGHSNEADYLISELLDFDKTIARALDFAMKDGETLVIVTADHETGGFTLAPEEGNYDKIKPAFSTGSHSATLIPVFAFGPGAETFSGIYENTEIYHKMMSLLTD